jgi:hypothetical protein
MTDRELHNYISHGSALPWNLEAHSEFRGLVYELMSIATKITVCQVRGTIGLRSLTHMGSPMTEVAHYFGRICWQRTSPAAPP